MRNGLTCRVSERATACAALALVVFFSRAWLIHAWGSPLPYWDQWGTEGAHLLRPWLDHSIRWNDFFIPQNEHRIALSKAADLALFIINGRWNMWWELLLNAVLHTATATALACFFWPMVTGNNRLIALVGLVVIFTAPSGWQNALWGFQSQVYFCVLFSVFAIAGLLLHEPFERRWWGGWFAAVLALFAQGSGVLAAISVVIIVVFLSLLNYAPRSVGQDPCPSVTDPRKVAHGLIVVATVVMLGWALRAEAPQHEPMHARSLSQFANVFVRCLGWPWINSNWLWIVMQAPSFWFLATVVRRRAPLSALDRMALALVVLTGLGAAAVAYSRGAGLPDFRPLSRYQDPLLLGVTANLFLALRIAPLYRFGRPAVFVLYGVLFAGLMTLTTTNLALNLPYKRQLDTASLAQVRAYLATHDASIFTRDPNFPGPHPNPAAVREVLDDPLLLPILPDEIANPGARPPWLIEFSPWLLLSSIALFLWTLKKMHATGFQLKKSGDYSTQPTIFH